jgi:hypothetical protein
MWIPKFLQKTEAPKVPKVPKWSLIIYQHSGHAIAFEQTNGEDVTVEDAWATFKYWYIFKVKTPTFSIVGVNFETIIKRTNISYIEIKKS